MIEAIGEQQFPVFFAALDRLLVPGGRACVQTILVPDQRWPRYRATPDWIERHVFPGCLIPSLEAITTAMRRSSRLMRHERRGDRAALRARRCAAWRERFLARLAEVRALGSTTAS